MKKLMITFSLFLILLSSCAPAVVRPYSGTTPTAETNAQALATGTSAQAAAEASQTATAPKPTRTRRPTRTPTEAPSAPTEAPSAPTEAPTAAAGTAAATSTQTANTASKTTNQGVPVSGSGKIPAFDHIVLILLENHSFDEVIGNAQLPNLNALAQKYVLLTQYHAIRHPSLPNYIALMGGDTFGITKDCTDCFLSQTNLADRIEAGGRTWKAYEEDMPSPCFVGNAEPYFQKHDPLIYFDDIRTDSARCTRSIVPMTQLDADLSSGKLPNFSFIMPNICNSGHDCGDSAVDSWVGTTVAKLQNAPVMQKNSLIIIVYDEANDSNTESCCGLAKKAGGRVAAVLISPEAKPAFQDATPYSHYSLLKTILGAWSLPDLGNTAMGDTQPILEPWK